MSTTSFQSEEYTPTITEICVVGRDMTEFNVTRFGSFIRRIDLSYNLLTKLRGLEGCAETLEELVLDNNQLTRIEFKTVFPKLNTLSLNKNRIFNLTCLLKDVKVKTPNLYYLSLLGNPCSRDQLSDEYVPESEYAVYRCHILHHVPQLRFLDHRSVSPKELSESRKTSYGHVKIIPVYSPLPSNVSTTVPTYRNSPALSENASNETEELEIGSEPQQPPRRKIRQGRRRFKYIGKNSEGNRFIKDSDL